MRAAESVSEIAAKVRESATNNDSGPILVLSCWLSCGLGAREAAEQHWGFLEALVRPGRAALGRCAGRLSRAN